MPPPTEIDIIDAARLACESYFAGENAAKRSIRMDHEALRALIRAWDARQETASIHRSKA